MSLAKLFGIHVSLACLILFCAKGFLSSSARSLARFVVCMISGSMRRAFVLVIVRCFYVGYNTEHMRTCVVACQNNWNLVDLVVDNAKRDRARTGAGNAARVTIRSRHACRRTSSLSLLFYKCLEVPSFRVNNYFRSFVIQIKLASRFRSDVSSQKSL